MATSKKIEKQLSIRAYAHSLQVDEKTVRNARNAGLLKKGYDDATGKIIPSVADKVWGNSQKAIKPKAGVSRGKAIEKLDNSLLTKQEGDKGEVPEPDMGDMDLQQLIACIKITPDLSYQEAMKRREIVALALDKIKLKKEEGILVEKEKVEKVLFAFGNQLKKSILSLPNKVIDDLLAAPSKIDAINILTSELTDILSVFSDESKLTWEL